MGMGNVWVLTKIRKRKNRKKATKDKIEPHYTCTAKLKKKKKHKKKPQPINPKTEQMKTFALLYIGESFNLKRF